MGVETLFIIGLCITNIILFRSEISSCYRFDILFMSSSIIYTLLLLFLFQRKKQGRHKVSLIFFSYNLINIIRIYHMMSIKAIIAYTIISMIGLIYSASKQEEDKQTEKKFSCNESESRKSMIDRELSTEDEKIEEYSQETGSDEDEIDTEIKTYIEKETDESTITQSNTKNIQIEQTEDKIQEKNEIDEKLEKTEIPEKKEISEKKTMKFIGSSTSMKFHLPECRYARNISYKNKVFLSSEKDAENKGYRPGRCIRQNNNSEKYNTEEEE